jgi:hypothetical protein
MMSTDDLYENWKQRRANVTVPADFADGVMKAVEDAERDRRAALTGWLLLLLWSRAGRISIGALAVLVCAVRVAAVAALFLFPR